MMLRRNWNSLSGKRLNKLYNVQTGRVQMNIREISKPVTAKSLNESLAKRFGKRIALEKFTVEQLEDARNKIRTVLSQVETNESFDTVKSSSYQKNKLFLDVLNAEIAEREVNTKEDKINNPEYLDIIKNLLGRAKSTEEFKDYLNNEMDKDPKFGQWMNFYAKETALGKRAINVYYGRDMIGEAKLREGAEDQAELVMAAKDMVDRVTGWTEDTAEMQTESMLELANAIRDEMGQVQSEQFVSTVKPALEGLYTAMESTRGALTAGVGMLTGEGEAPVIGEPEGEEPAMEPTVDQDADLTAPPDDGMGASEPAAGGTEDAGRARRESKEYSKKKIAERSQRIGTILSKKKTG